MSTADEFHPRLYPLSIKAAVYLPVPPRSAALRHHNRQHLSSASPTAPRRKRRDQRKQISPATARDRFDKRAPDSGVGLCSGLVGFRLTVGWFRSGWAKLDWVDWARTVKPHKPACRGHSNHRARAYPTAPRTSPRLGLMDFDRFSAASLRAERPRPTSLRQTRLTPSDTARPV